MEYILEIKFVLVLTTLSVVISQEHDIMLPLAQEQVQQSDLCPPWYFYNTTTDQCECYVNPSTDHIVKCTEQGAVLKFGYCMTHEEGQGYFVGLCDYFQLNSYNKSAKDGYISLPGNLSELNDYMCGPLNRKGVICSKCIDGFGPSVTSAAHTCSNCTDAWYGVPLYLCLEFVPITIFYFIVLFFRINVTTAPMVAFVFYSQIGVSTFLVMSNRYLFDTTLTYRFLNVLITFYGIWNLDFFRYIIPPFCVSPNIKPIHITFLYYVSAFYPLCLIIISWLCIHLHSRNFKPVIWLWNKLNGCVFRHTKVKWDAKNTMIDVFATFFLLSYAKLVFTCFRTISYGITIHVHNSSVQKILHVKSDPSIGYFSGEHLPFAVISAAIFLFALVPIPLLLALYPMETFRTILFKCSFGSRLMAALNIFVEKFYSCYRDGLDGGRDMRSFVSIHFFLRLLGNYLSVDEILVNLSFTVVILLYIVSSLLIALARPYKKAHMNIVDTLILANLALLSLVLDKYSGQRNHSSSSSAFYEISGSILSTIPLVGLTGVIIYRIFRKLVAKCYKRRSYDKIGNENLETSQQVILDIDDDTELPDRMLHPEQYNSKELDFDTTEKTQLKPKFNVYGSV